jgi:hypothetical protein
MCGRYTLHKSLKCDTLPALSFAYRKPHRAAKYFDIQDIPRLKLQYNIEPGASSISRVTESKE